MQVHLQAEESLAGRKHSKNRIQKVRIDLIATRMAHQNVHRVHTEVVKVDLPKADHLTVTASHLSKNVMATLHREENPLSVGRILPAHANRLTRNQTRREANALIASKNSTSLTGNVKKVLQEQEGRMEINEAASARMTGILSRVEAHRTETEEIHRHRVHAKPRIEKILTEAKDPKADLRNSISPMKSVVIQHRVRAEAEVFAKQILMVAKTSSRNSTSLLKSEAEISIHASRDVTPEAPSAANAIMKRAQMKKPDQ